MATQKGGLPFAEPKPGKEGELGATAKFRLAKRSDFAFLYGSILMHRVLIVVLSVALPLLASCAQEGTVVRKEFRPLPFAGSLGIAEIFRFELRLRSGEIRSQMVTRAVFARYKVGEYFNDRAKPAFRSQPSLRPEPRLRPPLHPAPLEQYGTPYRSMPPDQPVPRS